MFWTIYFIVAFIGAVCSFSLDDDAAIVVGLFFAFVPVINVILAIIFLAAFTHDFLRGK